MRYTTILRLVAFCLTVSVTRFAYAQKLVKVGEFTSYYDNVQFLPGGFVVVHNDIRDSKTSTYQYRSGRFVKVKTKLPAAISQWNSFSWDAAGRSGQIDRGELNKSIAGFLPPDSTVTALMRIPGIANRNVAVVDPIVLVCYETPNDEMFMNLHLLMVIQQPRQEFTPTIYTKLADILVAEEVYFGTLLLERQPSGTFVVVYFADGGNHQTDEIAIYLLKPRISRGRSKPRVR